MALDGTVLGAAMKTACTLPPNPGESMDAYRTRLFSAMGTAIVAHIVANAEVIVQSVTGVTPGPGVSGPGTGNVL